MEREIEVYFGPLVNPLKDQLQEWGILLQDEIIDQIQLDLNSVSRLSVRQLLRDSEKTRIHRNLMKRILSEIERLGTEA